VRSRLHSVILVPLLLAVLGLDGRAPTTDGATGTTIELQFPAERRVPPSLPPKPEAEPETDEAAALEGRVLDGCTREPVARAEVSIPELDRRAVTDGDGRFVIGNVPARTASYEVLVTCPGYQSFFADAVFEPHKRLNCEYRLTPVGW